jgi:hypothetical protein
LVADDTADAAIISGDAGETLATDGDPWFMVYGWFMVDLWFMVYDL